MDTTSPLGKTLALMRQIAAGEAEPLHCLLKAGEVLPLDSWHAPQLLTVEVGPELAASIAWGLETLVDKAAILSLELCLESGFNWLGLSLESGFESVYGGQTAIRIQDDQILFIATGGELSECGWITPESLMDVLLAPATSSRIFVSDRARRYLEEDSYTMEEILDIATQAQHAT